jgi:hypothetical protein
MSLLENTQIMAGQFRARSNHGLGSVKKAQESACPHFRLMTM